MQIPENRRDKILYLVDTDGVGLEIGPSFSPIAPKKDGFKVKVLDHATQAELRQKYRTHGVDVNNIEEVDFVWNGEPISQLVGDQCCFDWIIASHVIEHTPDLIVFLQECERLLKPNGVLSLAIPDKRVCFDYFNPITTTGDVLDAFYAQRKKPSLGQVFDHFANASARSGAIAWSQETQGEFSLLHTTGQAQQLLNQAEQPNSSYIDVHCWRFTPSSFELLIQDLLYLGLIGLVCELKFDSAGCEFHVTLVKKKSNHQTTVVDRLAMLKNVLSETG